MWEQQEISEVKTRHIETDEAVTSPVSEIPTRRIEADEAATASPVSEIPTRRIEPDEITTGSAISETPTRTIDPDEIVTAKVMVVPTEAASPLELTYHEPVDSKQALVSASPRSLAQVAPPQRSLAIRRNTRKPLIIPGSGVRVRNGPLVPRGKPVRRNAIIALVAICIIVITAFNVSDIRDSVIANTPLNAFSAFGSRAETQNNSGFYTYRVLSGDSIETIASRFKVTIGGIYKLNGFYLGDEITVGEELKIPNDPTFGSSYQPTAPPLPTENSPAYPGAPAGSVFGGCIFCSIAGYSTGGACAPSSQTYRGFGLIQPNPGAKFIRGFTWYHNGVDLSTGRYGTPIVAAQDGQVIFSGWDPNGFGLAIKINHCWGLSTSYGHLGLLNVKVGDFVKKGQVIGTQGSTGNSTGPHLHFMVWWHNVYMDPLQFYDHLGLPY